jgi:hypothetical protein
MSQHTSLAHLWLNQTKVKWILLGGLTTLLGVLLVLSVCRAIQPEIWYLWNFREIRALNPITHQHRVLSLGRSHDFVSDPGFGPSRERLAFIKSNEDADGQIINAIWITELETSTTYRITKDFYGGVDYLWLDNARLVVMGIDDRWIRPDQGEWFLYDIPTRQLRQMQPPADMAIMCRLNRASIYANHLPIVSSPPTFPLTFWELQDGILRLVG